MPIEEHPAFADAVAEMGPPPPEQPDETTLDMNPLIDVALVLLIFFIITATVATLRRTIELPPPEESDPAAARVPQKEDMKDNSFTVSVSLDERQQPVVKLSTSPDSERVVAYDDIEKELKTLVSSTGRKEMLLRMTNDVTWKVYPRIYSAATEAGVRNIRLPDK